MKFSRPSSERIVAVAVAVTAIVLAALGVWVFQSSASRGRSLTDAIVSDRITLGLLRFLVAATALYALTSIAVLVTRGRWLRSFSTTGIEVESQADATINDLKGKLAKATAERDEYRLMAGRLDG